MTTSSQQRPTLTAPGRIRRRLATWLALAVQLASGPLAAVSHQHEHARHLCCCATGNAAPARTDATAAGHAHDPAGGRRPHRCRFSRCRDARVQNATPPARESLGSTPQAGDPGEARAIADGASTTVAAAPAEGRGSASTSCAACEFLAKHVAVVPWTWFEGSVIARWDEPRVHPTRPATVLVAAFLARGPPA